MMMTFKRSHILIQIVLSAHSKGEKLFTNAPLVKGKFIVANDLFFINNFYLNMIFTDDAVDECEIGKCTRARSGFDWPPAKPSKTRDTMF